MQPTAPNPYTFNTNAQGNVEVFQNGSRIATGTAGAAEKYGYTLPNSAATGNLPPPTQTDKSTPQTTISNANITEKTNPENISKLADLTNKPTGSQISGVAGDGITRNADGSFAEAPSDAVQNADGQTWLSPSTGKTYAIGSMGGKITSDPTVQALYDQMSDLKTRVDATALANINNIQKQFETLITQQGDINKRQEASAGQSLLVGGTSRYAGENAAGIMATQASYGLQQISDLVTKENNAIVAAQQAQQDGDYKMLDKMLSIATEAQKDRQTTAKALSEKLVAANQKIMDAKKQQDKDIAVGGIIAKGITDTKGILDALKKSGFEYVTANDIADTLKNLNPNQTAILDVMKTAKQGNAPDDIIKAIGLAKTPEEAMLAAKDYMGSATGIVGEYNYYVRDAKAHGQTPVDFNTYQTMDANRKAKVAAAGVANGGGLTPKEGTTYSNYTTKYQADPIINAAIKASQINTLADQIIKDPNSATNQLASLYIFVKNLDPDSAVREGELALAGQTQSYLQKFGNSLERVNNGRVLSPEAAKELAEATKRLVKTWQDTADKKTQMYQSQANHYSPAVGSAFKDYIDEYKSMSTMNTGNEIKQTEDEAKQKVIDFGNTNPTQRESIKGMVADGMSYQDIMQVLGQ